MRLPSIPSIPVWPSLVGGGSGGVPIDPAFIVTHMGGDVTNAGIVVTNGMDIDPAFLVLDSGNVVTSDGQIVTNGA